MTSELTGSELYVNGDHIIDTEMTPDAFVWRGESGQEYIFPEELYELVMFSKQRYDFNATKKTGKITGLVGVRFVEDK